MAEKISGIPKDWNWRVIQLRPSGWKTWLIACGNERMEGGPFLHPTTDKQAAMRIFGSVKGEWPNKTWAVIDPDHNFIVEHRPNP